MTAPMTDPSSFGLDNNSDSLSGFYQPGQIGSYADTANGTLDFGGAPSLNYPSVPAAGGSSGAPASTGGASGFDFGGYLPDFNNPQGNVTPGVPVTPATPAAPGATPSSAAPGGAAAGTGMPAGASSPTSSGSSNTGIPWLDTMINAMTGGKGFASSVGSMAPYLADFALAQKMADKTQAGNQKTIQPLYDQATKYLDAAGKELGLYESGSVTPAQQIMLDQNAAGKKAQLAQYYNSNGIQDSTMMMQGMQQIDDSTVVMKQGFVDDSLKKALALEGAGMTPLLTAVQDKLISDTQLSQTMMELMGNLAKAWAYQTAQSGGGSGGSGGGTAAGAAGGGVGGLIGKGVDYLKGKVGDWLGGGAAGTPDLLGAGGGTIADVAGPVTGNLFDLSGIGADLGSSAAASGGSAAAGAGSGLLPGSIAGADMADTAAYTPDIMEATSPGAAAGAGSMAAGLAMGAGAFAAMYGLSRVLASTGKMSDADWVKSLTGNYATANDQYQQAMKTGDTGTAFKLATTMSEAATAAAMHYKAMGDTANAAKWTKIYQDLTNRGSWYNTQLVNRSGGATSGQHGSKTSKLL